MIVDIGLTIIVRNLGRPGAFLALHIEQPTPEQVCRAIEYLAEAVYPQGWEWSVVPGRVGGGASANGAAVSDRPETPPASAPATGE